MADMLGQVGQTVPIQSLAQSQAAAPVQAVAPVTVPQAISPAPVLAPAQPQAVATSAQPQGQNVQVPNYSGVNIQIFNPSVVTPGANAPASTVNAPSYSTAPAYPANYYTQNLAQTPPAAAPAEDKKKTEKREIVQLTDEYIKNLEGYLNNQNKDIRLMGAKEVLARLQEDESRKNDPALNALVNKMIQDPYQPVKFIAMALLESRAVTGDSTTVGLLKTEQQKKNNYGEDALKASNILLKMSANTTEKEFEAKNKPEQGK